MPILFYKLGNYLNDINDGKFKNKSFSFPNGGWLTLIIAVLKLVGTVQDIEAAIKKAQPWYDIVLTNFGSNLYSLLSVWLFILFGICVADFKEEGFRSSEHSYKNTFSTFSCHKRRQ